MGLFSDRQDTMPAELVELGARVEAHLSVLAGIERALVAIVAKIERAESIDERLRTLEGTIDKRLAESAAELLEAKEKFRLARNAEQRSRDQRKAGAAHSSRESSEEDASDEELVDELAALVATRLRGPHGGGGAGGGMHAVPEDVGDPDDPWDQGEW